ncbi:MAG: class I SAM-dependent methyltransferase [Candidatus Woesearchaeota archaeon]
MKQKTINCILCNSGKNLPVLKKEGHTLVRCSNCGLVFVNPRISDVENVYLQNKVHTRYYERTEHCDELEFRRRLCLIKKYSIGHRILDVGCAVGTFLKLARKAGWDCYGIDLNAHSIAVCKKAGLNVKRGFLNRKSYPKGFFDAIHMSDVIEHMENPLASLKLCASFLKPNGVILITTPNFGSRWARKFQIKPTDHLYYFTKRTLRMLVERAGLKVLMCLPLNRYRDLKALKYSISIKQCFLSRLFLGAMKLLPIRSCCIRLPLNDDIIIFAQKPFN